ncbi:Ferric uptake regulation protein [Rosistilla oblonga]|uniref:Ferric uptake regulation protein n=1 Tax=Rosistilla oblonga TaxID=2527990 RepID=A0A518IPS3_9BACT|nr:Fur family transcriptional regulator [Rosistilla oblonga]QDV11169.1 Ferric uptake regulation protein [Rosistilla oblonga]QDV55088.1 Ferric uptake regulation protein [Rosistilla oblonga]
MSDSAPLGKVAVSLTPQERFEEFLQSRGQRNTEQRRFLVDRVFSNHEHFDVDSLIEQLPRKGQENYVSRPTVYRALKEFVDAGLLRCFQLEGRSVYEHDYGYPQHDHLYCTRCQKLIEFTSEEIMKIRSQVAVQHSFRVTSHRLIIQGVCQDCSRRRKKRKQDLI